MFIEYLWKNPDFFFTYVVVIVFSICVHEAAHAWVAAQQGDHTASRLGYLTLNPFKVMGVQSVVMLLMFGFAWGAVPVDRHSMRHRWSPLLVSCAGPLTNLVLAVLCALISVLLMPHRAAASVLPLALVFQVGLLANCFLFIFNMLPIPIMDGWELYTWLMPSLRYIPERSLNTASVVGLLLLFISPAGNYIWLFAHQLGEKFQAWLMPLAGAIA